MATEVWRVYFPQPSLLGEHNDRAEADKHAEELGEGAVVLARWSDEEQAYLRHSRPVRKAAREPG